ncbi:hypothetical protein FQR65_LT19508 [Abscondita terminalis]|nr:hypothetical protein FQR65_LT19508 [Abscondita terminalis]
MIFLKRIEAYGFKSFAEETILNFDYEMTGIVGPNGEQSLKSLRGDNMEDIVFSGSESKKALNFAEITLVFDNSNKVFSTLEFEEVSIKRKYNKIDNESEYFINGARVKAKDIHEVALETGLTKSSLAMISQGSVNNFVESKPEERRVLFDEAAGVAKYKKRKEATQNEVGLLVSDLKVYNSKIEELSLEKDSFIGEIKKYEKILESDNAEIRILSNSNSDIDKKISKLNKEFAEVVQLISEQKILKVSLENESTKKATSETEKRLQQLKNYLNENSIQIFNEENNLINANKNFENLTKELSELSSQRKKINMELDDIRKNIVKFETIIENLISKKNSNDNLFEGVKNIMDNKNTLPGVLGIVQDLITVDEKYLEAMGSILQQGSLQNIVMKDNQSTKNAIDFLKNNKAGYATFLPLDNLKPKYIDTETRFIIQSFKGFVGFANEIIKIDKKYQIALDYLLSGVLVVKDYDLAIELSKLLKFKYNIVTLTGERILPQGAIVGGSKSKDNALLNENKRIEFSEDKKKNLEIQNANLIEQVAKLNNEIDILREKISQAQNTIGSIKQSSLNLNKQNEEFKKEYRVISGKDFGLENKETESIEVKINKLVQSISENENRKIIIQDELNVLSNIKNKSSDQFTILNQQNNENYTMLNNLREKLSLIKSDITLLINKKMYAASRLAEHYNLTVEKALEENSIQIENENELRDRIDSLRIEISKLGNVNIESIQEFEEESRRYNEFVEQTNDVHESIKNLKKAIEELDKQMVLQFKNIIKEVNKALPETFTKLFGGGTAKINYTDPEDVLNSGIEIDIKPPGKTITNLNLLSGGEKSMVALSVLFSILKVRPIPLVVLDEVEAPLDIANVERFAKYIKTFTNNTQFLIVTHRTGTMENCDLLYGATMEQKGVTKIVKVKLVEAQDLVSGGSTSVNPFMQRATSEYAKEKNIDIVYNSTGSQAGVVGVENGMYSAGFISKNFTNKTLSNNNNLLELPLDTFEEQTKTVLDTNKGYTALKFAIDAIVLVYNPPNLALELNLVDKKPSGNTPFVTFTREDGAGTRTAFSELTGVEDLANANVVNSNGMMISQLGTSEASIGYVSYSFLGNITKESGLHIAGIGDTKLAGIPSVVFGLFALDQIGSIFVLMGAPTQSNMMTASVTLAFMALPTMLTLSINAVAAVPESYRFAALGLGMTKERTTFGVVIKAATPKIIAAVIAGMARVIGETMAVILIAGNSTAGLNTNGGFFDFIFSSIRTLAGTIGLEMLENHGPEHESSLYAIVIIKGIAGFNVNELITIEGQRSGIFATLLTTLLLVASTLILAIPLALFVAVYLTEYSNPKSIFVKVIRFCINVLASTPSIVFGVFGLTIFVIYMGLPMSIFASSLTLTIVILPMMIASFEDAITSVPLSYREAAYGMGMSKTGVTFKVVIPNAMQGILTGIILGMARIIGESAPVYLTLGTSVRMPSEGFMSSGATLTTEIYMLASEGANSGAMNTAYMMALITVLLVLFLN